MRRITLCAVAACLVLLAIRQSAAEDWPTLRGPQRNCVSTETGLLETWPKEGPKLLWTAKLEKGNSSPVIANGRVFCLGKKGNYGWNFGTKESKDKSPTLLYCLDRTDGKTLWTHEIPFFKDLSGNYAYNTAAVEGDRVYVRGPNGDARCVAYQDGKLLWRWPENDEPLKNHAPWSYGTIYAPDILIAGDLAIFTGLGGAYHSGQEIFAVNKTTGKQVWKKNRAWTIGGYNTVKPVLVTVENKTYLLIDRWALEPASGEVAASWSGNDGIIDWSSAVVGNVVYMDFKRLKSVAVKEDAVKTDEKAKTEAPQKKYETGLTALQFSHEGGKLTVKKLWEWVGKSDDDRAVWTNSPVVAKDLLFMNLTKLGGTFVCLSATDGKKRWQGNPFGVMYSEPLYADGKIFLGGDVGLVMIAADPAKYCELGRLSLKGVQVDSGGGCSYHAPALSQGHLFIRDNTGSLYCYDIRGSDFVPK